jgi:hypothetical protein
MKNLLLILLAVSITTAPAFAEDGDAGFAAAFLRNGVGARPLGMGGAYTAIAEGAEATYYNPAGLGYSQILGISMSYKSMALDRHLGHIAVAFPIRNEAAMAASWVNAGVSDVPGMGNSRQSEGLIGNSSNAFALSFAKAIDSSISIGGSLRYQQEKLSTIDAFAIGMDLGAIYRPIRFISIGGTVQNLGATYRWDSGNYWASGKSYDDVVPVTFKFGLAGYLLDGTLLPAIDFEKSNKMGMRFRAGAEYWFVKKASRSVEDEYEEGRFTTVYYNIRYAGIRAGIDRGAPTFGASYAFPFKETSLALEYAYLVGHQGTDAGHLFTLKLGL